jgi:hypothetical protein
VDSETAQALLEMIEQGSLTADPKVKSFLGELSHKPATGPSTQVTQ